jgi:hypothetical protein
MTALSKPFIDGPLVLKALASLAVVWLLSLGAAWIAAGDFKQIAITGIVFVVVCVAATIVRDWRSGIYLFLIWLLFEDMVRKYMGNNMTIYFAKDFLAAIVYVTFLKSSRSKLSFLPPILKIALGLFVLFGIVQVFNPNSPSFVYGVLGIKLYFYYIPLLFVGYALFRSERELRRFLFVNMGVAGVIALLGIVQSIVGLDFLNPKSGTNIDELGHLMRYTPSGLAVTRPPSVFVSDGRFAQYIILTFILGLGTTGYLLMRGKRGRKLTYLAVGLLAVAAVMSGGRGCFTYALTSALLIPIALLWGAPPRAAETYRLFKAIRRSFIVVALSLALVTFLFPQEFGAHFSFYRETVALDSADSETSYRTWDYPVAEFTTALSDREWLMGHGIGTASLGVQYVSKFLGQSPPAFGVESGWGTLVLEYGILGLILWLGWTIVFIVSALRVVLKLKGKATFPVGVAIVWYAFLLLFPFTWGGMPAYQNYVLNAYFWLLAGILFRLPTLAADESLKMQVAHGHGQ